jgi:hypothetical protein
MTGTNPDRRNSYCVSLAVRAIADSWATRDPAGADERGADFRAFSRSPRVYLNEAGEMIEFEVMIRPIKALAARSEEIGNRIGPQLVPLKQSAGASG